MKKETSGFLPLRSSTLLFYPNDDYSHDERLFYCAIKRQVITDIKVSDINAYILHKTRNILKEHHMSCFKKYSYKRTKIRENIIRGARK